MNSKALRQMPVVCLLYSLAFPTREMSTIVLWPGFSMVLIFIENLLPSLPFRSIYRITFLVVSSSCVKEPSMPLSCKDDCLSSGLL